MDSLSMDGKRCKSFGLTVHGLSHPTDTMRDARNIDHCNAPGLHHCKPVQRIVFVEKISFRIADMKFLKKIPAVQLTPPKEPESFAG